MVFVALDDKKECIGYYHKGNLVFDGYLPDNLYKTWRYIPALENKKIEYAQLYCDGLELNDACPEHLKNEWEQINKRMKSYIRSFGEAKINLNDVCFYDLVPEQFLKEFCDIKCRIIQHVFDSYERPHDYEYRFKIEMLLNDIKNREIKIDPLKVKNRLHEEKTRSFLKRLNSLKPRVEYKQFGTKTGRLTTTSDSVPILNMEKEMRGIFVPQNGFYLELDYNAAELRTLIALNGFQQPTDDIHSWNMKLVGGSDRDKIKRDFFAWLYGSVNVDGTAFESAYKTERVLEHYWDGKYVTNRFGRKIESDRHHALNYIVQSTASDLVLRQTLKVSDLISNKKSYIAFIIHDSIILDLSIEDKNLVEEIVKVFSDTIFGKFKTTVRLGTNLNNMREINI